MLLLVLIPRRCLTGSVTVLEIVFVGLCEAFVCLDFVHCFCLGRKAHRFANGASIILKNVDFSDTYLPNSMSHLGGA